MNRYSFLCMTFMWLFFMKAPACAQLSNNTHPSFSPSVHIPPGLANTVFSGSSDNAKQEVNCYTILYDTPGYQNAQAQGACYEAQTACVRLGLIQQFLQPQKTAHFSQLYPGGAFSKAELTKHLQATITDVKVKLLGCVLAAAASIITDSVIDQAGFAPSQEEKSQVESMLITSPLDSPSPSASPLPPLPPSESSLQPLPQNSPGLSSPDYLNEPEESPPEPPLSI
jgi:hypothetical protein